MRCAEARTFGLIWPGGPIRLLLLFFMGLGEFWPGRGRGLTLRSCGASCRAGQGCIEEHRVRQRPPAGTRAAGRSIPDRQGAEGGLR